jgi:hypothetical protein
MNSIPGLFVIFLILYRAVEAGHCKLRGSIEAQVNLLFYCPQTTSKVVWNEFAGIQGWWNNLIHLIILLFYKTEIKLSILK